MNSTKTILGILKTLDSADKNSIRKIRNFLKLHVNSEMKDVLKTLNSIGITNLTAKQMKMIEKRDYIGLKKKTKLKNV